MSRQLDPVVRRLRLIEAECSALKRRGISNIMVAGKGANNHLYLSDWVDAIAHETKMLLAAHGEEPAIPLGSDGFPTQYNLSAVVADTPTWWDEN